MAGWRHAQRAYFTRATWHRSKGTTFPRADGAALQAWACLVYCGAKFVTFPSNQQSQSRALCIWIFLRVKPGLALVRGRITSPGSWHLVTVYVNKNPPPPMVNLPSKKYAYSTL